MAAFLVKYKTDHGAPIFFFSNYGIVNVAQTFENLIKID